MSASRPEDPGDPRPPSPKGIRLERSHDQARADLRIEIPPVNVLDTLSLAELARQVVEARPTRLLVLTGLPRAFSAGVSLADHVPEPSRIDAMLTAMRDALAALLETPAVTLAAVSGACLGGGAELVSACDLVLVSEDARVGFPEIRHACFPPGACALLPGRIGEARAAEWILSGARRSGREAADAGFAARAVPAGRLEDETERLAERISRPRPTRSERRATSCAAAGARRSSGTFRRPKRPTAGSRAARTSRARSGISKRARRR